MQTPLSPVSGAVPVELTQFVGRARELDALRELAGTSRLLTITGAGGSGKTRLALELVTRLLPELPGGVTWVELASISNDALVPGAVLRALDPTAEAGAAATERTVDMLRDGSTLLVLDNCEHLIDACAALADTLLRACPGLRMIATSREALGVQGERAWLVPPMGLPPATDDAATISPDALAGSDAVQLFVERARDAVSDFEITAQNGSAVADICARVDGIPLAIELAAARVRVMSPEQIRDRLSDAFALLTSSSRTVLPRHRTLRAAIDWSHDLLPDDARAVLRRLAVFRGGFTLEAAESVASGDDIGDYAHHDVAAGDVLEYVARLLDRSLLHMREQGDVPRYSLLETVRQYAALKLAESGDEAEACRALAHYIIGLVARTEPDLTTRRRRAAVARLEPELDNIREVLRYTLAHDPSAHVRLVGMLWWFWFSTRHWVEARGWIDGALAVPAAHASPADRAAVLFARGALASLQADAVNARVDLSACVELCQQTGDRRLEAYALNYTAMTLAQVGDVSARSYAARAAEWFRAHDDLYGLRLALLLGGMGEARAGDMTKARAMMGEAVAVARTFGQDRELGVALQTLGSTMLDAGDVDDAAALFTESLHALRRDWSYLFVGRGLELFAMSRIASNPAGAARTLGAADALRERVGASRFHIDQVRFETRAPELRAVLGDEEFERLHADGRARPAEVLDAVLSAPSVPASGATETTSPAAAVAPEETDAAADTRAAEPGDVADLRLRLLGPMQAWVQGVLIESWPYAKPKELLAYLAMRPTGATRVEIAAAIWPDSTPAQARNTFHVTAHHLRKALGHADWIVLENERYRLAAGVTIDCDAVRFEAGVRALLARGSDDIDMLQAALALYAGHYLDGDVAGSWRDEEQDRLRRLYTDAALRLAALLDRNGRADEAVAICEELIVREPLLEEAHRRLIAYWTDAGDRIRAIRHFDRLAALLRDELELEPDADTVELYERARSM